MSVSLVVGMALFAGALPDPSAPLHVEVEAWLAYGYGDRHAIGDLFGARLDYTAWQTATVDGVLELGVLLGYQAEPFAQDDAFLDGAHATGAAHRLEAWLLLGHRLRFLDSRALSVGVHVFAGWTHVIMRGALTNTAFSVNGSFADDRGAFTSGVSLDIGYRLSSRVGLFARALAPFPYVPAVIAGYVMATLGVSIVAWP